MGQNEMLSRSRKAARRDQVILIVSTPKHHYLIGAAEVHSGLHQRVEHGLELNS